MHFPAPPLAVALLAAAVLAACQPAVSSVTQDRAYSPSEFRFAAENKALVTVITGNPFAMRKAEFDGAVLAAMQPVNWGFPLARTPRTRFTTTPDETSNLDYRVEVLFAPAEASPALCEGTARVKASPRQRPIRARMAFCHRAQLLSTSVGRLDEAASPSDPRFRRMVAQMTSALFPHRDNREDAIGEHGLRGM
jgi:hypothetical protein